jgi:hypothetical protein
MPVTRALLDPVSIQDVFKVLREVTEHVGGSRLRVVGTDNQGRQLTALAAQGLPQFDPVLGIWVARAG